MINGGCVGSAGEGIMMTKNSRRKKTARQRASRTGERYTRARRNIDTSKQGFRLDPVGMDSTATCSEEGFEAIHHVQQLVEARGWEIGPYLDDRLDEQGMAISLEVSWDYPASFNGVQFDDEDDGVPRRPRCGFFWDDDTDTEWIIVETVGNWGGCEEHCPASYSLPLTETGIAQLAKTLARVEEESRAMDPAPLVACTANGPCAQKVAQREAQRNTYLAWHEAMIKAYDEKLTEQQRAEFHAWEKENLDGHSVATSDWPGWVPLIGAPPWRKQSQG